MGWWHIYNPQLEVSLSKQETPSCPATRDRHRNLAGFASVLVSSCFNIIFWRVLMTTILIQPITSRVLSTLVKFKAPSQNQSHSEQQRDKRNEST